VRAAILWVAVLGTDGKPGGDADLKIYKGREDDDIHILPWLVGLEITWSRKHFPVPRNERFSVHRSSIGMSC
jgi:hypothetical protein